MVEFSVNVSRPVFGTLPGFVSASFGAKLGRRPRALHSNINESFKVSRSCVKRDAFAREALAFACQKEERGHPAFLMW
jgi:hypothetical protein